ncbi:MAG: hypothetical protein IT269_05065 [Saprospiraceae bacterium]|nr:hypothetical protein [Saprospiraceae bacterium]
MRKQLFLALTACATLAGLVWYFNFSKTEKNEAWFQAVGKYVYAYTGGQVSSQEPVRIRFNQAAVSMNEVGKPVPAQVFSISPKIQGSAIWEDQQTILLKPEKPMAYGQRYEAVVHLDRIWAEVPSIAEDFDFNFRVRELNYDVVQTGIRQDPDNPGANQALGTIKVNEPCTAAHVEKMLKADQNGRELDIRWSHSDDGLRHEWTIVGVERTPAPKMVNLRFDGDAIGVDKSIDRQQTVAPAGDFVLLNAQPIQLEEQYLLLNFSEQVQSSQDLSGLIRVEGFNGKLRFVTDGNFVRVYPSERIRGAHKLRVDNSIRSAGGQALQSEFSSDVAFEDLKPGVRLVGRGAVIPQQSNGSVLFPFEAVGLTSVDVEIFKIFNSNILQYLQVNEIEGNQELERVGKIVVQKRINLSDINPQASSLTWQRYAFDLQDMIRQDPGAIYQVRIGFRRSYANTGCTSNIADEPAWEKAQSESDDWTAAQQSIMGGYRGIYWSDEDTWYWESEGEDEATTQPVNYDEGGYNWDLRENPCAREYYASDRFVQRNAFVSDLGLTAKRGNDRSLFLAVTDLHTTQSVAGLDVELFNYQLQSIAKVRTESDGTVYVENLREVPFLAVATGNNRRGYLRMADGNTLSLSRFDVAGVEAQKGLKGYLYGERGVWRPGDSLFLNFVLEDKIGNLPQGHPVVFELTDSRGALQYKSVQTASVGGVYPFHCATRPDAPTGNWNAKVMVGGASFTKQLKIETVKPNRLKLDLDFGKKSLTAADFAVGENAPVQTNGQLSVNWLHGATAKGLKAKVEMQVRAVPTEFKNYKGFSFDDPSRYFFSDPEVLFEANLDQNGKAAIPLKIGNVPQAPGKLIANFKVRAFEAGGDFSTDNFAMDVFPYDRFIGISVPTGKWGDKTMDMNGGNVQLTMVNANGQPLSNQKIEVSLYRVDWRWWWDEDATSGIPSFNNAEAVEAIQTATLTTDSRGLVNWKVKPTGWGRFLIRATDPNGSHAAGDFFWSGYPDRLDDIQSRNAAAMLPFTVEKEKYNVGEEVRLKVPASDNGRILLTIENGSKVAKHMWFDAKAGDNILTFKAEPEMAPNVYAHVSLIQPHAQTANDLPIRMYGVMPVNIENPASKLEAVIDMPDVLEPDNPFTINLRERGGKACVYTLAVVDEGLLDLTRFKTPNPWDAFFAREALGVKTWDIYDYVLGAYGVSLDRILAIGGDGINQKAKNATQVNRFKPAVIHLGPYRLEAGQTAKHRLSISNYVGSVRVMAVMSAPGANGTAAYGNGEKTCPVRKPLMIAPTLPRVLGPGETLRLPVEVFAMDKKIKNASVTVREKSGLVSVNTAQQNLSFPEVGEKMAWFDLKVGDKSGVAKFTITAEGSGETTTSEIELAIRNPNPLISRVTEGVVEAGQSWSPDANSGSLSDVESTWLEVSSAPPLNLSKQLDELIQYPHGCLEQTTSGAFPQLYADLIAPLSDKQQKNVERNIKAAITKLQNFQLGSGAFTYWPGGGEVADWACTYAGHFLLEAKARGYAVPPQMLDKWLEYQTKISRTWDPGKSTQDWYAQSTEMSQAYRLLTLAIAGQPDAAGMNRLREIKNKYEGTASLLAEAFAIAGKKEAARDMLDAASNRKFSYDWWGYTYGSNLRDLALRLETLTAMGDTKSAYPVALQISQDIGNAARWFSTQEVATCLRAISKYAQKSTLGEKNDFTVKVSGREKQVNLAKPYYMEEITGESASVSVKNTSKQRLYVRTVQRGRTQSTTVNAEASNISLNIRYTDLKGQVIDPVKIKQGTDFLAEVTVNRTGDMKFDFNELALTQIFPSGWEIMNTRMNLVGGGTSDAMDYQDIRDDRVMTYFDIPFAQTRNAKSSRTYRIQLNAAYAGRYYLAPVACEAMYDNRIRAVQPGKWVEVEK